MKAVYFVCGQGSYFTYTVDVAINYYPDPTFFLCKIMISKKMPSLL